MDFPRKMWNGVTGDEIEVESQETMDLCLSRGYKKVSPKLRNVGALKKRIEAAEKELALDKQSLADLIHEEEVATKATSILEKMEAEKAAKAEADEKARVAAEEKAVTDEKEKMEADAKAQAEFGIAGAKGRK